MMGLLLLGASLFSMVGSCTRSQRQPVVSVTPMEAYGVIRNDFGVLVDVREADETREGMAAPARWMPYSKIGSNDPAWRDFLSQLSKEKDKQIIIYCSEQSCAAKVADLLADQGFKAANMGAYSDWVKAGLPAKTP